MVSEFDHYVSFVHDDFFLLIFNNERFGDNFHCVEFSILLESAEIYITKPSTSDTLDDIEGIKGDDGLFDSIDGLESNSLSVQESAILLAECQEVVKLQIVICSLKGNNLLLLLLLLIPSPFFSFHLKDVVFQKLN